MRILMFLGAVLGLYTVFAFAGAAETPYDIVYLTDGTVVQGRVGHRSPLGVLVENPDTGAQRFILKKNVAATVLGSGHVPDEDLLGFLHTWADNKRNIFPRPAPEVEDREASEAKEELKMHIPETPEHLRERVGRALRSLSSTNPSERAEGKVYLLSLRDVAVPVLVTALMHDDAELRTAAANLLGQLRARSAIKYLIEALYAALPSNGQAPAYQRRFVRALREALQATTGQVFIQVESSSALVQRGLQRYIEWYGDRLVWLPPQVGEPVVDPVDPVYVEKISALRKLKLQKHAWPRPLMSADIAVGRTEPYIPPVGVAERQADRRFAEEFPSADRKTLAGLVRDEDRAFAEELISSIR